MYSLFEKPFFILGHRGFSELYPENTMLSFSACEKDMRIDGIELDVHECRSGEIVVVHDSNLKRVAGIDACVEDLTWDEIQKIDVGTFKSPEFSSCRIPLLSELFETFGTRFVYDIELKVDKGRKYKKLCDKVWNLICANSLEENVMVSSFNPFALRFFNKVCMMSIPTADIYDCNSTVPKMLHHGAGHLVSNSSYSKPDFTQVNSRFTEKLGLEVITWTVNTREDAMRLMSVPKVKGLIGNNPVLLADCRDEFAGK